jgi:hypothetical protein
MSQKIAHTVNRYIKSKKPGWVFSSQDFAKVSANKAAVERTLSRLKAAGGIKRLRKGLYYKPVYGRWGEVPPEISEVVKAVERSLKTKIMPSGAAAANMLNLTTQVPAKAIFYTTRNPSNVQIGKYNIEFKKVSPAKLSGRGRKVGLILNAMNFLGKNEVSEGLVQKKIASMISETDRGLLAKAARSQSKWIRDSVENIVKIADNHDA